MTFLGVVDERAAEDVKEDDFWRSVLATKGDLEATAVTERKRRKLTNLPVSDENYSGSKRF